MSSFITANARYKMAFTLSQFNTKYIHRAHTDSFLIDNKIYDEVINFIKIGTDLGYWKIEKQGHCKIKNSCNIEWF